MILKKLLILLICALSPHLFSQDDKIYFEDALAQNLRKFNNQSDLAIRNKMPNEVDTIFNSFLNNYLKNTYVSDLRLKKVSGGYIQTDQINTPFLLITKNSAIIQADEEIETINAISDYYKGQVEIIVMFWDRQDIAKKSTRNYNKNVTVVYADERYNNSNRALSVYKHSFGVPTCFYVNKNKQIFDIDRKFFQRNSNPDSQKIFAERTHKGITELLVSHEDTAAQSITLDY